jgi:hypothetical protein
VSSVLAVRPDLVYGARGSVRPLELRTAGGTGGTAAVPGQSAASSSAAQV